MELNSIKQTNASQKGTAIGKAAGFGIGSAYILKNRKDIFETAIKEGSEKLAGKASHNKAVALGCGACALFIGASTVAGKFIGKGIGKLVDKHNQKENDQKVLKESADAEPDWVTPTEDDDEPDWVTPTEDDDEPDWVTPTEDDDECESEPTAGGPYPSWLNSWLNDPKSNPTAPDDEPYPSVPPEDDYETIPTEDDYETDEPVPFL